jgi:hypothetical protein
MGKRDVLWEVITDEKVNEVIRTTLLTLPSNVAKKKLGARGDDVLHLTAEMLMREKGKKKYISSSVTMRVYDRKYTKDKYLARAKNLQKKLTRESKYKGETNRLRLLLKLVAEDRVFRSFIRNTPDSLLQHVLFLENMMEVNLLKARAHPLWDGKLPDFTAKEIDNIKDSVTTHRRTP